MMEHALDNGEENGRGWRTMAYGAGRVTRNEQNEVHGIGTAHTTGPWHNQPRAQHARDAHI